MIRYGGDLNVEDRQHRRRWIQGCCLFYSIVIALLLTIGAFNRSSNGRIMSADDYTSTTSQQMKVRAQFEPRAPSRAQAYQEK